MNPRRIGLWVLVVLVVVAIVDQATSRDGMLWGYRQLVSAEGLGAVPWDGRGPRFSPQSPRAAREGQASAPMAAGDVLLVRNPMGSVDIAGVPGASQASVDYTLTVYADSEALARRHLETLSVQLRPAAGGGGLQLDVQGPERPRGVRAVQLVARVLVPQEARVDVRNAFGQVAVRQVGGPSTVINRYEETSIGSVRGNWVVQAPFGHLGVRGVDGNLEVSGDYGSSDLSDIAGALQVRTSYRQTAIDGVGQGVTARLRFGALELRNVKGPTEVEAEYAGLRANHLDGPAQVRSSFGEVSLEGTLQAVDVRTRFAGVDLHFTGPLDHRFELSARNGNIVYQGLRGPAGARPALTAEREGDTQRVTGAAGGGRHTVYVETQNGDIRLSSGAGAL